MTPSPVAGEAATVASLLLQSARRWPDADALIEGQTVLTHGRPGCERKRSPHGW